MARLYTFSEERFPKLPRSKVREVSVCTIYYLYYGRNAWNSNWVTQYNEGCMHFDLERAFSSAEHKRTKGSVFYIVELPALVFRSAAGHFVTEINTDRPLSGYSATALAAKPLYGTKLRGARDCYLSKAAPMLDAAFAIPPQ